MSLFKPSMLDYLIASLSKEELISFSEYYEKEQERKRRGDFTEAEKIGIELKKAFITHFQKQVDKVIMEAINKPPPQPSRE